MGSRPHCSLPFATQHDMPATLQKNKKGNWCFDVPTGASRRLLAAVETHLLELDWVVTFRVSGAFVGTQAIDHNKAAATSEGF